MQSVIELRDVHMNFDLGAVDVNVIRGVSLKVNKWEFICILGQSWSWKSTLLNLMGLLQSQTRWEILIFNENTKKLHDTEKSKIRSEKFGFIFQQYNLIPWLSAYENITLPLFFSYHDHKQQNIIKLAKQVWIDHRLNSFPAQLSWWEQQRVALLRALVNNPEIIFWDEPTWNLDSSNWKIVLDMLITLNKEHWKTLVIVTHDIGTSKLADRIITVKDWKVINE